MPDRRLRRVSLDEHHVHHELRASGRAPVGVAHVAAFGRMIQHDDPIGHACGDGRDRRLAERDRFLQVRASAIQADEVAGNDE